MILLGQRRRNRVDRVELAGSEGRKHGVGALVHGPTNSLNMGLLAVEAGVTRQDRCALVVVGGHVERATADDWEGASGCPLFEVLGVVCCQRLEHMLRHDVEPLQLGERGCDGSVIRDHERRLVGGIESYGVSQRRCEHSRRARRVLDDQVAGIGSIGCRQWLAVRPFAAGLEREGVDLAVGRDGPRFGPVARGFEVLIGLDERRINLWEEHRRAHHGGEGVERVGADCGAKAKDAVLDDWSLIVAVCDHACALGRVTAGRRRDAAAAAGQQQTHEPEREYEISTCPHFNVLPLGD